MLKVAQFPLGGSLGVWISNSTLEGHDKGGVVGKVVGTILLYLGIELVPSGSLEKGSPVGDLDVVIWEFGSIDSEFETEGLDEPRELDTV